jgi:hypothetical protein
MLLIVLVFLILIFMDFVIEIEDIIFECSDGVF